MHANYQAAIMIRSQADEGTSWLMYTRAHIHTEGRGREERKMEVCWSVTRVVALKKEEEVVKMAQLPAR